MGERHKTGYHHSVNRVAKCHGYDGYICLKIFAGWGKKSGRRCNLAKFSLFWEDLHNYARFLCINRPNLIELSRFVHQNYPFCTFFWLRCQNCRYSRAFLGVRFSSRILLRVKELTFRNSGRTPRLLVVIQFALHPVDQTTLKLDPGWDWRNTRGEDTDVEDARWRENYGG